MHADRSNSFSTHADRSNSVSLFNGVVSKEVLAGAEIPGGGRRGRLAERALSHVQIILSTAAKAMWLSVLCLMSRLYCH